MFIRLSSGCCLISGCLIPAPDVARLDLAALDGVGAGVISNLLLAIDAAGSWKSLSMDGALQLVANVTTNIDELTEYEFAVTDISEPGGRCLVWSRRQGAADASFGGPP